MANLEINIIGGGLGRVGANKDGYAHMLFVGESFVGEIQNPERLIASDLRNVSWLIKSDKEYLITPVDGRRLVYWHITEFFRLNPSGVLYVDAVESIESVDEAKSAIKALTDTDDDVRMLGVVIATNSAIEEGDYVGYFQGALESITEFQDHSMRCVIGGSFSDIGEGDYSSAKSNRVMLPIARPNGKYTQNYTTTHNMSVGTLLGRICSMGVHQKPSWRSYPITENTDRWDGLQTLPDVEADIIAQKGYTQFGMTPRLAGGYVLDSRMACDETDDFAIITHGRVIDKAVNLVTKVLAPYLDSPLYVDANSGELAPDTIAFFEALALNAIQDGMVKNKSGNEVELSVDPSTGELPTTTIYIDPAQNVLATETLKIVCSLVPVGSAKKIVFNIGLSNPAK